MRAQVIQGQSEQLPLPFPLENLSGRFGRDGLVLHWFELDVAAALLPVRRRMLIGGESFHGHPEVGAEGSFGRVESREKIPLQRGGEKALSQILSVFVILAEFEPDESIDRLPVQR